MNLFIDNKYTKWYYAIITNAQQRSTSKDIYSELHHIIPKSMGGSNDKSNLVSLYFREHFIVHMLLPKMCVNKTHRIKMLHALSYFNTGNNINRVLTAKESTIAKEAHIQACRGKTLSVEHKLKISKVLKENPPMRGRTHSEETILKIKLRRKLKPYIPSDRVKKLQSNRMKGHRNSTAKHVLIVYNGISMCYPCLKYFHEDSKINYSTLRAIAQGTRKTKLDLKIVYL